MLRVMLSVLNFETPLYLLNGELYMHFSFCTEIDCVTFLLSGQKLNLDGHGLGLVTPFKITETHAIFL